MFNYRKFYYSSPANVSRFIGRHASYYYENIQRKFLRPKVDIKVDINEVEAAIRKGAHRLINIQRNDGSIGSRDWEIWDTANAVLGLLEVGITGRAIGDAIEFILQGQMDHGGFFYAYLPQKRGWACKQFKERDIYCIETSSAALMAIYGYKRKVTQEIQNGLDFLLEKQRECGGWELPYLGCPEDISLTSNYYPSVTGYALQTLLTIDKCPKSKLSTALGFLEKSQRRDGSWGKSIAYFDTEGYAIKNISKALALTNNLNLSKDNKSSISKMLSSCARYVRKEQNADGSWSIIGPSTKSVSTPLFLQSLLNMGVKDFIGLGVRWLINNQNEKGSWDSGKLDGVSNEVFVIPESLMGLSKFKNMILKDKSIR
jgi:hypothetical protein